MLALTLAAAIAVAELEGIPCSAPDTITSTAQTVGIARSKTDASLLYCEYHLSQPENVTQVVYYDPKGRLFAEKKLTYGSELSKPEFVQTDSRSGEMHEMRRNERVWIAQYRAKRDAKIKSVELPLNEVDVVDAGFDHAVRQYWTRLRDGKSVVVKFASTVFQRSFNLRIHKKEDNHCPAGEGNTQCLWVEANNGLIRMFVDPLQLLYNEKQQLVLFQGVVNIQDAAGKKQSALIRYYHRK